MRGKRVLKRRRFVILQNANIISLEGYFLALATTTKPLFSYEGTTKRGKAHFVFWLRIQCDSPKTVPKIKIFFQAKILNFFPRKKVFVHQSQANADLGML